MGNPVKQIGRALTNNYVGEDVLFKQYRASHRRGSSLGEYLEGAEPSPVWVRHVAKRTSKNQPEVLYRLCISPKDTKIGSILEVSKKIVSASDQMASAKYAGCSYHHDQATDLTGLSLALIEIIGANVCLSHEDILYAIEASGHSDLVRARNEREYIVRGPISGKVVETLDVEIVKTRKYKQFLAIE